MNPPAVARDAEKADFPAQWLVFDADALNLM
jgi:hypothetical protein